MDLIRAKQEGSFAGIRRKDRQLLTRPTYQQVMKFINECHTAGVAGATIDYDIELQPKTQELSCIGLSHNSEAAMCIPFVDADGDYFSAPQELCIMQELDKLFSSRGIAKRGQNVIFDSHFLLRKYGIRTYNLEDTMVAQGIIAPEYRKSLEFITSVWTDIPYYKHDGKMWLTGVSDWEKGWQYNCYDVLSCAEAHPKQLKELESQGNLGTYWRQRRLIEPLTYMMEHGIRVNIVGMQQEHEECKQQVADLDAKINMLMDIGEDYINLDSPKQLADYFYVRKGVKPYLNPDTHKPTVDITALTRLANRGFVEASLILKLRQLKKRMATFLNIYKVDADGRIRCSYNPVGTKYGRISSSANIFGTGGNLQHVPHSVLSHFMADEGYVIYSLDMSQIENRIVAYVGNIVPMIQAFENGLDVHRLTAAMISTIMGTPRTYDTVTSQERQDLGKRPNHAFNYGYGYKSFSLRYEIPERDAKRIHTAYHAVYPGLSKSYWKFIEDELKASRSLTNLFGRRVQFFGQWSEKLLHEAYSCIPQSTCGDLVNDWGVNFIYYSTDPDFHEVELLTQIHDSIELQIPLRVSLAQHARILCKIRVSLEQRLQFGAHTFSIPVDLTVNNCLNKEKGIEIKSKNFSHEACDLEPMLESAIHKLGCAELDYLTH
jgi:DNA polymerase-1